MTVRLTAVLGRIHQLAAEKKVQFTLKAVEELADLDMGLDVDDACDVLAALSPADFIEQLQSGRTGEWMYVFKPKVAGVTVYVKLILREECLVVSFHEDEPPDEEHS